MPQGPQGFPPIPATWAVEFETFPSHDQTETLFAHLFRANTPRPELASRAIVCLHGQGEHSGRYGHWPHYLQDTVGSIYAIDHRGHGQSTGLRGHTADFDLYAHDVAHAITRYAAYLRAQFGQAEIHLVAHSMGGLIALRTLLLHPELPIRSVALSAPMIELAFKVPKYKDLAAKLVHKVLPSLPLPTEPLAHLVSRDPAVVAHYKKDPLNHGLASTAFYFSYPTAKDDTLRRAGTITQDIQVMLPLADQIIAPGPTQAFFKQLRGGQKKLIEYADFYHEIFNEPDRQRVFADLQAWLVAHSAS